MAEPLDTAALRIGYGLPCAHDEHGIYRDFTAALDEVDRLRAQLAEVEAERDLTAAMHLDAEKAAEAAEARLNAVLALCDQQPNETPCSCDPAYTERGLIAPDCAWHQDIESFVTEVRAAAAGDDRD